MPAYNEERFISEVVQTMPPFVDRVYAANDCSTDHTTEILAGITEERLVIINHEKRRGAGAAMLSGYKRACAEGMDIVAIMAGDGQMDPAILDKIINPVLEGQADYSKGNRLGNQQNTRGMPAWRLFGNRLLTQVIRIASGYRHVSDPLNGYTAITRESLTKLDLDKIERGYAFETDLLIKLNVIKARVSNVEMPSRYGNEKSKIKYLNFMLYTSWVILRDFIWRIWKKASGFRLQRVERKEREVC